MSLKPFTIEAGDIPKYTYEDYKIWEGNWELIKGIPYAMSPSPKRKHQKYGSNFLASAKNQLEQKASTCNCDIFYELDWIINNETVVRPDLMIVCGNFETDFLTFAPALIVEISSEGTKMKDRNTKFRLYEANGVNYYILADTDNRTIELFELIDNMYKQNDQLKKFQLTDNCFIELNLNTLF